MFIVYLYEGGQEEKKSNEIIEILEFWWIAELNDQSFGRRRRRAKQTL